MTAMRYRRKTVAVRLLGWVLLVFGLALVFVQKRETHALEALSDEVHPRQDTVAYQGPEIDIGSGLDWESLKAINPDVAAWVRVEGTDIDLPIMAPSNGDMSYYLQHDLWGNRALAGVPFLDHRCTADDIHRLVYGHRLFLGGQFSALQLAYQREVFDGIGVCQWSTPSDGTTRLVPFCASRRNAWYADIQRFDLHEDGLEPWLRELAKDAGATSADAEDLASLAQSVVTLVTCSSELSGQPWRTIVVFVEVSEN